MADQKVETHRIDPRLLEGPVRMLVVGCGGTGAAFASGLPNLHHSMVALGHPGGLEVTLADGDRVTDANRGRTPFTEHHVGRNKAEVLITGINRFWGLRWKAYPRHITSDDNLDFDIVVGCMDSRAGRRLLAASTRRSVRVRYWLDAGNGPAFGQVVLGQPARGQKDPLRLRTVDELLSDTVRLGPEDNGPSCSVREALTKQAPFINHLLAYHMLFLLAQLFSRGETAHHGAFVAAEIGLVQPIPVDPAQWAVMRGGPVEVARGTSPVRRRTRPAPPVVPLAA